MWISEDIWVGTRRIPRGIPHPFPSASPTWTPAPNQNPEYRDPRLGLPCFVYVRVWNRGTTASTGSERLRVFWSKAALAMLWPDHWSNYVDTVRAPTAPGRLYGQEITKPRKNAAHATIQERLDFTDAVNATDTAALSFPGGGRRADLLGWRHRRHRTPPGQRQHFGHNPAFVPWHREFINRFEILLQEERPTLTLLYWDWQTDPRSTPD